MVHPDRGGNKEQWLLLSGYYGVLVGIWETKATVINPLILIFVYYICVYYILLALPCFVLLKYFIYYP